MLGMEFISKNVHLVNNLMAPCLELIQKYDRAAVSKVIFGIYVQSSMLLRIKTNVMSNLALRNKF